MPRGRTQHPTPDLFSEASAPEPPPTPASQLSSPKAAVDMAASLRRYLLPKDLPNALKRLDDGELASLLGAALDEGSDAESCCLVWQQVHGTIQPQEHRGS